MEFNFADEYVIDGLVNSDLTKSRSPIFASIRNELDDQTKVVDLIAYYYELAAVECPNWLFDQIAATDESFSKLHSKREAKLFAKCLIKAAMADNSLPALLGIQTAAYSLKAEADQVELQLTEIASNVLIELAIDNRKELFDNPVSTGVAITPKTAAVTAAAAGDFAKVGEVLKAIVQDTQTLQKTLAANIDIVNDKIVSVQQENEMLWWYVGGWSRSLNVPLSTMEPGLSSLVIGADLAKLTKEIPAPAAISALIEKALIANNIGLNSEFSIRELVNNNGPKLLDYVLPEGECYSLALCPIISGFVRFNEVGEVDAWVNSYKTIYGFDPEIKLKPVDIASQIYREILLLVHFG